MFQVLVCIETTGAGTARINRKKTVWLTNDGDAMRQDRCSNAYQAPGNHVLSPLEPTTSQKKAILARLASAAHVYRSRPDPAFCAEHKTDRA